LRGLSGLISPAIFTFTFATFISPNSAVHLPGAPFLLAAVLLLAAFVLAWRVTQKKGKGTRDKAQEREKREEGKTEIEKETSLIASP
jgi:DHA1 family tetracycline resistance protein-like MFS transporter